MGKKQNELESLPEIIIIEILKKRERKRVDYHSQKYRLNNYSLDYHLWITIVIFRLSIRQHILYKETSAKSIILRPTKSDRLYVFK